MRNPACRSDWFGVTETAAAVLSSHPAASGSSAAPSPFRPIAGAWQKTNRRISATTWRIKAKRVGESSHPLSVRGGYRLTGTLGS
jgi:hypothetical protein